MVKIVRSNKMKIAVASWVAFVLLSLAGQNTAIATCSSGLSIAIADPTATFHIKNAYDPAGSANIDVDFAVTNVSNRIIPYDQTSGDVGVANDFKIQVRSIEGFPVRMTHLAKRVYGLDKPTGSDPSLNYENFGGSILPGQVIKQRVNLSVLYDINRTGTYSVSLERTEDDGCSTISNVVDFHVQE